MTSLRIIGDVHAQIESDDLLVGNGRPYLAIVAEVPFSVQIGDMGDAQTYDQLNRLVDPTRHRFVPGNHENYDNLPPHALGNYGSTSLGGVDFFFIRGAASDNPTRLVELGRKLGRTIWFEQEELSEEQMLAAEHDYLRSAPDIVLTHDGPTEAASFVWQHAIRHSPPHRNVKFRPSRTNIFLARLLEKHAPKLWIFGHHHRDWRYRGEKTQFICLGELSCLDIDPKGQASLTLGSRKTVL